MKAVVSRLWIPLCLLGPVALLTAASLAPLAAQYARADASATVQTAALDSILAKPVPESLDELRAIEQHVRDLSQRVLPATVSIRVGTASGSGVVVSEDGYVLTAGHVGGRPNRQALVIFPDGTRARATTLGVNNRIDSGLIKITDPGPWPHLEMGDSTAVQVGDWCLAIGHPGGWDDSRPGVVRLGRIIRSESGVIQSDCTLVGGDSGGPLLDMKGRVIAIHSRIGNPTAANFHVPIDTYHLTWERLVKGDIWGDNEPGGPFLGVAGADHPRGCRLDLVGDNLPAHRGGLRVGDIITAVDDQPVHGYAAFVEMISMSSPGDQMALRVIRDDRAMDLTITVGERPE